ncbi:MAG: chemotaxis protein CheY [Herbinix sp.]|jgi:two-component system chemotaxis response regulator CheY|nr:chemotaxis protein CheY [Herbinix sp.]
MNTGEIIKNLRKEQNVTQEDLAKALNISAQSISKWENGLANPDIIYIPLIANYFKVALETLFFWEEDEQSLHYKKSQAIQKKLLLTDDIDSIIELWEDMHFKYPNDYRIVKELILALCSKNDITLFHKIFKYVIMILRSNQNKSIENEVLDALKKFMLRETDIKEPQKVVKHNTNPLSQQEIGELFGNSVVSKRKGKRIMLVDDSPFMRKMQNEILTKAGYEIISEATNGNEAVEQYKLCSPDIVIMDIIMPVLDGISATKHILSFDPTACIIMCSAMVEQSIVSETKQIGVSAFVAKPFHQELLLDAVGNCIE